LKSDNFGLISEIAPDEKSTWENRLFVTLDIDWAADFVLERTIDLVESHGIKATWFITHDTPVLQRLKDNKLFELGIHPNFNFLLQGDARNGRNAEEVIDRLLAIVPDATAVRSHDMTQSSSLLNLFKSKGLTHDSNHFIPAQGAIPLKPWLLWNGLIKVPYFWEDDVHCMYQEQRCIDHFSTLPGIKVFDFHPIHVYLNTENMDRYERCRPYHREQAKLKDFINEHVVGAMDHLDQLINKGITS